MDFLINIIICLVVGGICGCIAGAIMKSSGTLLRNVILGVIGAVVGGVVFSLLGLKVSNIIGSIISGVVGSCIVIWGAKKLVH